MMSYERETPRSESLNDRLPAISSGEVEVGKKSRPPPGHRDNKVLNYFEQSLIRRINLPSYPKEIKFSLEFNAEAQTK